MNGTLMGAYRAKGGDKLSTGDYRVKSYYDKIAIVEAGALPKIGDQYTMLGVTPAVTVSINNFALVLKDLAYRGKASFLMRNFTGKKAATENLNTGVKFGNDIKERLTGEVVEMFSCEFANYVQNISVFNAIRKNPTGWDIVFLSGNVAEVYTSADNDVQFTNISDEATGDNTKSRIGTFEIGARGYDGQIEPIFGIPKLTLVDDLRFTLAEGTLTNVTKSCSKYKVTATGTVASIAFSASPVVTCGEFKLEVVTAGELVAATGTTFATIDSTTGLLTIPTTHVAGTTKYRVSFSNGGVYGFVDIEVVV